MKFTDGYWMLKPEYEMHFAVEYYRSQTSPDGMEILCPSVPVQGRGDILNSAALSVRFSAPMENVLRVRIRHFKGVIPRGPYFELFESPVKPVMTEDDQSLTIQSGKLCATISKSSKGWGISYSAEGKHLTESGYHGTAHARHLATGQS